MIKSKSLSTVCGQSVIVMNSRDDLPLENVLLLNRKITSDHFFEPSLSGLHDPFLMPDMDKAVERIFEARKKGERIVIFGDYDVDGVSSTALLFKYLTDIGCTVSYRLPHRIHDGYGLKSYFFDELSEKNVKLVITVDCGTRDIEAIHHAKSLGIDVIVTDHHAVPELIPEDVIALINPKRKDSKYPFSGLAGVGVAFKLVHALTLENMKREGQHDENEKQLFEVLTSYIDLASLGTVADCMPLIDENRIITSLGLKQMKVSTTSALRKYIENLDREIEGDADIIGFQIGPRINAAGRMDSPLKALHWLLADEARVDDWLDEVEMLNTQRQEIVKELSEAALLSVDEERPILFFTHDDLEHGIIGLIAGKLTEAYHRPAIVFCRHTDTQSNELHFVASCRSPEWCNLVELLDLFKAHITTKFHEKYGNIHALPPKNIIVECQIAPSEISFETLTLIDRFRPFGIGNPKPKFYLENLTISQVQIIGAMKNHLSLSFFELPKIKCLLWNFQDILGGEPQVGDIVTPVFSISKNVWKEHESIQIIIDTFIKMENESENVNCEEYVKDL